MEGEWHPCRYASSIFALARADLRRYYLAMDKLPTAEDIEARAKAASLSIAELCRQAGVAQSTFHRWRGEKTSPSVETVQRMLDVVAAQERA